MKMKKKLTIKDLEKSPELIFKLTSDAIEKSRMFLKLCNEARENGFAAFTQVDNDTGEKEDFTLIKGTVLAYKTDSLHTTTIMEMNNDTIIGWEYGK
jgi:hypothetical protein